jgi:DNA-binding MarR family transcriptional regulator
MSDVLTDLIIEVFRLNGRLVVAGDALVGDLGLTSARWQVLGALAMAPAPLPVAHIGRNMGLSRQNVQRLVDELAAKDIVRFEDNPHHRRAKLVVMTERGVALYAAASARQAPWAEALGAGLAEAEIAAALAVLRRLRQRLDATRLERGTSDAGVARAADDADED